MSSSSQNTTQGFDLDAISAAQAKHDDVVYELGGGTTVPPSLSTPQEAQSSTTDHDHDAPLAESESEQFKKKGNECFKEGNYLDAIDFYTDAIDACPGSMTGQDILDLKAKHEEQEREKANQRYQKDSNRRMANRLPKTTDHGTEGSAAAVSAAAAESEEEERDDLAPTEFIPPPHEYGTNLSIYYSNKAACLIHLQRYNDAIHDCDLGILVNPNYAKAYIRRMTCYEQMEQTDSALRDAKQALELSTNANSGSNAKTKTDIRNHIKRLEKLEEARMEKLKDETMGKLKDLGNSILGNFGMSMDNFKADKDPNTGSYSIRMV